MEIFCYGFLVLHMLGTTVLFVLYSRSPRCRRCRAAAVLLTYEIPETTPPVFALLYVCPRCDEIVRKRLVYAAFD